MNALKVKEKRMQRRLSDYVPDGEILGELVEFFSLFSDKTRLKILSALSISETCVGDISEELGINQTTVSHQLRLMRSVGAVNCRREGKVIYYSLSDEIVGETILRGLEFLGR